MVWNKVGEFLTTISVNGDQQSSYNQSDNADYNVNVSGKTSFETTRVVNENGGNPSGTFSQGGWHHWKLNGKDQNVSLYINGNLIQKVFDYSRDGMINVNAGDTWSYDEYQDVETDWNAFIDRVDNETTVNYPNGNTVHVPTGVVVNSVNQS